jgi:predicted Zn-dependent protease
LPAGIVLAERTLFLPSVGAMLVLGAVLVYTAGVARRRNAARSFAFAGGAVCAALLATGIVRSARRARVWHDNETLFRQAVVDSPNAYRAHFMLGAWAFDHQRQREGERELRHALNLFPYDPYVAYNLAEQYRRSDRCEAAIPMYRWALGMDKNFPFGHSAFSLCLLTTGSIAEAKAAALDALKRGGDTTALRRLIAIADSIGTLPEGAPPPAPITLVGGPSKLPESMQKTAETTSIRRDK